MADTLRERQKQMAHTAIVQAAADEIVETGLDDLSLQAVAERAGVSKRTLYNYFDGRDALLAAVMERSAELTVELGGALRLADLDTAPERIRATWRAWDSQGSFYEATLRIDAAGLGGDRVPSRSDRHTDLVRRLAELQPDLTDEQRDALASLMQLMGSPAAYWRLSHEDGLGVDAAAELTTWTFTLIRDALARGEHPFRQEES